VTQTPATGSPGRLNLARVLTFASASMPNSALVLAVAVFMTPYLTGHVGLTLGAVALTFGAVRFLDIGVDFVLGLAMDRTRTPIGRYRPWMIASAPILMAAVYVLFMAPPGSTVGFLIAALLAMYLGMSILALSNTAWASTLATSYNERSRLFGAMTGVGVVSAVAVLLMPVIMPLLHHNASGDDVHAIGWLIIILAPITIGLVTLVTPERIAPQAPGVQFKLKDYWDLISRPSMVRVLIADFCLTLGPGWMSALYFFFFQHSRGFTRSEASQLLLVYIAAGLVGAPLMGRLATRISKHRATIISTTVYSLTLITLMAVPQGNRLVALVPMFVAGFMAAGFNVLTRSMTADIADEVRLEQGKERTGLLFAITTLTGKLAGAMAITLTLNALAMVHFNPRDTAVNTPAAIHGLELVYLLGPIFFVMVGGLAFVGYRLTSERHGEIRRQLDERDALYDEAPVVETLSGPGSVAAE
jgi:GPH family glycoside/pentoside/hexuronide:cation symporter